MYYIQPCDSSSEAFLPRVYTKREGCYVVSTYYENLSELSEYSKLKFDNRIVKSLHFSMKTRRNDSCISFSTPNSQTECCF